MADSILDNFIHECEDPTSYPTRLRLTHLLPYALKRYEELLNEEAPRIFSKEPDDWIIRFWDSCNNGDKYRFAYDDCTSLQEIQDYLWVENKEDPVCRHVFIEASHSLAPLDCSREMLTSLFYYHQVMPRFLDIVLSFGALRGLQRCIFEYEDLTWPCAIGSSIPQVNGRSGNEIRYCYNLWSVEKSDHDKCPWAIRQAGLYHSIDTDSKNSTWIYVKTNDVLRERIQEATISANYDKLDDQEISGGFVTHLVVFEWCKENWSPYLTHLECGLLEILTKLQEAPVNQAAAALQKADSNNADSFQPAPELVPSARLGYQQMHSNLTRTTMKAASSEGDYLPRISERASPSGQINPVEVFDEFKFGDLQHLHILHNKLKEADMILNLNSDIMMEVVKFYQSYLKNYSTDADFQDDYVDALSRFTQRTNKIVAELQRERKRIATLVSLLKSGKSLFDAIVKFKNAELSRFSSRVESLAEEMQQSEL
ncbi:hypothetical protein F4860DRAFT_518370 [Xylaria cubensis]|nr:hypothetical protein F4860DRAFT_518370 [Xylaria cubensis]